MKKLRLSLGLLMVAVILAACQPAASQTPTGDATDSMTPVITEATSTLESTPQATETPQAMETAQATIVPSPTPAVPETRTGYITKAYTAEGKEYIKVDYVDIYSGQEAITKALADGSDIVEKDEDGKYYIPNDYYIRNVNPQLRTFQLTSVCEIKLLDEGVELKSATFAELISAVDSWKRLATLEVLDGNVYSIEEIYTP